MPTTRTAATSARSPPWCIKSTTAHLFHIGDSRIYRLSGNTLEQLTNDHRVVISSQQSYLGRALGVNPQIEIDYQMLRLEPGDVFVLATDGVYEHLSARHIAKAVNEGSADLDQAAKAIVDQAFEAGSEDNLTVQIVRVDELPDGIGQRGVRPAARTAAAAAAGGADGVRRLPHRPRTARLQPQPHLSRRRHRDRCGGHAQDSVDRFARRSRLSEAVHDGGMGGAAHRQPACAETLPADAQAQFSLRRDRIYRRPDAERSG